MRSVSVTSQVHFVPFAIKKVSPEIKVSEEPSALVIVLCEVLGDRPLYIGVQFRRAEHLQQPFVVAVAVVRPPWWLGEFKAPAAQHPIQPVSVAIYQLIFGGHIFPEIPPPTALVAMIF